MSTLLLKLPPLAPDYSGVATVFHDLDALVVIHDASGCTGTYTGYDEPRWFGSASRVYCSGLREMDATMGDDEKLMGKIEAAVADKRPSCVTVIGSPVPMLVGFDFRGFASLVENTTGVPAFGFSTTGLDLYDKGASQAYLALGKRFIQKGLPRIPGTVSVLGACAMDGFDGETIGALEDLLNDAGLRVLSVWGSGSPLEELSRSGSASVNWAVTAAALPLAEYMEKQFGIPFVSGFPAGGAQTARITDNLRLLAREGSAGSPADAASSGIFPIAAETDAEQAVNGSRIRGLLCGEPFFARSLAQALEEETRGEITARPVSFFGLPGSEKRTGVPRLADESVAQAEIDKPYAFVAGDPLFLGLADSNSTIKPIEIPHRAVSGRLHNLSASRYFGSGALSIFTNPRSSL